MPGDFAGIGAARALTGAGWPVMLDQGRVEIERDRFPLEQRMHPRKQLLERPVELAQMPKVEARQKAAERRRIGHRMASQLLLRRVAAKQRCIVETLTARDQRLTQRKRLLRRRIAASPLLHR